MKLYPFQEIGVNFLLETLPKSKAPHRYLCDEMGLGKTVTALAAFARAGMKSALIICPSLVKQTWKEQLETWTTFYDSEIQILSTRNDFIDANKPIVIVNYELLYSPGTVLKQLHNRTFDVVIIDEAHKLKEASAKITKLVLAQQGKRKALVSIAHHKWLLSGTPMPNRPIELYPIVKTLASECIYPYTDYNSFGFRYCNGFENDYGYDFTGASNVEELATNTRPFMLRREIKDVYTQLPDKVISHIYTEIDIKGDTSDTAPATLRKQVGIAKIPFVVDFVVDKIESGESKIVVFAYTRDVVTGIADHEKLQKYNPVYIWGGISLEDKLFAKNYFITNKACKILVVQINTVGTGTDGLQNICSCMIGAEPEWSHGIFNQMVSRLHRIGQNFITRVYLIVAKNTLDNAIVGSYKQKQIVVDKYCEGIK